MKQQLLIAITAIIVIIVMAAIVGRDSLNGDGNFAIPTFLDQYAKEYLRT